MKATPSISQRTGRHLRPMCGGAAEASLGGVGNLYPVRMYAPDGRVGRKRYHFGTERPWTMGAGTSYGRLGMEIL
jgi:hypothetical protein